MSFLIYVVMCAWYHLQFRGRFRCEISFRFRFIQLMQLTYDSYVALWDINIDGQIWSEVQCSGNAPMPHANVIVLLSIYSPISYHVNPSTSSTGTFPNFEWMALPLSIPKLPSHGDPSLCLGCQFHVEGPGARYDELVRSC